MADNVAINQGTNTNIATDDVSSVHYQKVKLDVGADGVSVPFTNTIGTVSIVGTNLGLGTTTGLGTVTNVGSVTNAGTVKEVSNLATGTVTVVGTTTGLGTVTNVGSLTNAGTVKEVGNIASGSIKITLGTVVYASQPSVYVEQPTASVLQAQVGMLTGTVTTIAAGTQNTLGTVAVVNNIAGGTVQVNPTPLTTVGSTYGTLGTAGGSAFGTISGASGAGTKHYVTNVSMSVTAGTVDCYVGFGTALNGAGVLERGNFAAGGGLGQTYSVPIASSTNSEICYELAGAGSVYFSVKYWKGT